MRRRLLNLLTALSLLLCVTSGSCTVGAGRTPGAQPGKSIDRPAIAARPRDVSDGAASGPPFGYRMNCLPSVEERIVKLGPSIERLIGNVRRHSMILYDPHTTEEERFQASVGLQVANSQLQRLASRLSDLTAAAPHPQPADQTSLAPGTYCTECGRNLTGNVSGTCPKCGTKVAVPPPP